MGIVVVSVVVALVVAVVVAGVVVVGMRGDLPEVSEKAPELAGRFEWAARHLNGEAVPSQRMADLERALGRLATRGRASSETTAVAREGLAADHLPAAGELSRS